MGRGGLGGAAPAYLQAQAAQQAADIAQKRRMTEKYGDVEAKQREEAKAKSKDIMTPYEAGRTQAGEIASRQAIQQMASLTEFEKEAISNKNALDRLDLQYKKDIQLAKDRQASELQLQKIREDHDYKIEQLRRRNANALEQFRRTAPTDEQRNFDAYLVRWQKNPANKDKQETDAFSQFYLDKQGGASKNERMDLTALKDLRASYSDQINNNLSLKPEQKAEYQRKLDDVNAKLEAIAGSTSGLPSLTGGNVDKNNPLLK